MSSAFQITFRGVLPDEELRELAEAMHAKLKAHYGRGARCHIAIEHAGKQVPLGMFSARVQLESPLGHAAVSAEALHENPVRAVRSAFAQAYLGLHAQKPLKKVVASEPRAQGQVLLLFGAQKPFAQLKEPAYAAGPQDARQDQEAACQASRNEYLSVLSARTRG